MSWTWNFSNLTGISATCFASDTNGHIIAGTNDGMYYSSQSTPGVWTKADGSLSTIVTGVASTADGSAMFAVTDGQIGLYFSLDYGHTWNDMVGLTPTGPFTSVCCNGSWFNGGYINIVVTQDNSGNGTTYQTHTTQMLLPIWIPNTSISGINCTGIACNSSGTKYTLITDGPDSIYDSDGTNINANLAIDWSEVPVTQGNWTSVACSGDGSKFIACNKEEIWTSTALQLWTINPSAPLQSNLNPYVYVAISHTGQNLYACFQNNDEGGFVYSLDTGNNIWATDNTKRNIYAIYVNPIAVSNTGLPLLRGRSYSLDNHGVDYAMYEPPPPPICFKEGSKILCLVDGVEQYIPIETMRPGTLVKTALDGYKPVAVIGFSKVYNPGNGTKSVHHLVKCTPAKYPELTEDLVLTGAHSILVDNITDKQRADLTELGGRIFITDDKYRLMACVDDRSEPYEAEGLFTIWHFALEHTQYTWNYGVYANGLLVETTSLRMIKEFSGMTLLT
jgi:hypothetical protein